MNDGQQDNLTPKLQRAQQAVRELPRPGADPAFRARLKQDFVSGTIPARAGVVIQLPERSRWRWARWAMLAAAMLATVAVFLTNPYPGPVAVGTNGQGYVIVDGQRLSADSLEDISRVLHPGARVELAEETMLDVDYRGTMSWRFYPGTILTLPQTPGRWFGRSLRSHLDVGEAALRTERKFPGLQLALSTDEGRVVVTGTLISVYRDEEITCVCVQEGTIHMNAGDEDLGSITAGQRVMLYRDGSPPEIVGIARAHRQNLLEFDRSHR